MSVAFVFSKHAKKHRITLKFREYFVSARLLSSQGSLDFIFPWKVSWNFARDCDFREENGQSNWQPSPTKMKVGKSGVKMSQFKWYKHNTFVDILAKSNLQGLFPWKLQSSWISDINRINGGCSACHIKKNLQKNWLQQKAPAQWPPLDCETAKMMITFWHFFTMSINK